MESRLAVCLLLLQLTSAVSGYATVYYMDNWCGRSITVYDAIRLKLRSSFWPLSNPCVVIVNSASIYHSNLDTRMSVKFNSISLSRGISGLCTKSRVDISDSDGSRLNSGSCGYSVPYSQPWKTTGSAMTVTLKKMSTFSLSGSFDLLITQFTTGFCDSGEFDCWNGRCIDNLLTCDGYNNCGDNSDETDNCSWSPGVTAGVVIACICGISFFLLFFGAVYRRRTYGRVFWGTAPYARAPPTIIQNTRCVPGGTVVNTCSSPYGVPSCTAAPPPPYPSCQGGYPKC